MAALNDLARSGKVHYLWASAMYAWQFQKAQYVAEKKAGRRFQLCRTITTCFTEKMRGR